MSAITALRIRQRAVAPRDRERVMVTPEGLALPLVVASRAGRIGALVLDLGLMLVLALLTTLALGLVAHGTAQIAFLQGGAGASRAMEFLFVLWATAMFLFRNAYFLYFELGPRGATPGKRVAGIRVAARDGGRLSPEMVIARNLLRDIELFLPLVLLGSIGSDDTSAAWLAATGWFVLIAAIPLLNRDGLRAGDIVAGTWVVEAPRRRLLPPLSARGAVPAADALSVPVFTDAELAVYGELELQTLERVLRENRRETLVAVRVAITARIGRAPVESDPRAFLEAYYTQLRARLESGMRLGRRKADKFARG